VREIVHRIDCVLRAGFGVWMVLVAVYDGVAEGGVGRRGV
jgi:hypothetical protein